MKYQFALGDNNVIVLTYVWELPLVLVRVTKAYEKSVQQTKLLR